MTNKKETNIIAPNTDFIKFMRDVKRKDSTKSAITKDDEELSLLGTLEGWKVLKKYARGRVDKLRSMVDYEASGRSLEELGVRFLVADLVAGEMERLIRRVEQAKAVYEEEQKDKKD